MYMQGCVSKDMTIQPSPLHATKHPHIHREDLSGGFFARPFPPGPPELPFWSNLVSRTLVKGLTC